MPKALWTQLPSYRKKMAKQVKSQIVQKKKLVQAKQREPRKRITFVSDRQAALKRKYNTLLDLLYGNPRKARCGVLGCVKPMEDNHHTKGRRGPLLLDARWFIPVCRGCHRITLEEPERARQMMGRNPQGTMIPLLCAKGGWNHSE